MRENKHYCQSPTSSAGTQTLLKAHEQASDPFIDKPRDSHVRFEDYRDAEDALDAMDGREVRQSTRK